nr:DNA replication helicase [Rhodomonas sp. NIES-1006]
MTFTNNKNVPYSLTIERSILSEILLNKETLSLIFYKIRKEFFYSNEHQYIFEASKQIYEEQIEINVDTLADRLKALGYLDQIGGIETLIELMNLAVNVSDLDTYLVLLTDKYIRRQLIHGATKISELAYQSFDSIESLFDQAEKILFAITQEKPSNNLLLTSEVLLETFVDLERRSLENEYSGIKSGFFDLDEFIQGFQKSDLIIIAGRPSMGKTAFALNLVRNVSELQPLPVIVFSLEMSRQQLVYRFLSRESQVMHSKLRSGNINQQEWYAVSKAITLLANLKIYLDDTPSLSLTSIRNKVNTISLQHNGIGMIVIDYLQLLNDPTNKDSRVQELSRLTRGLKILAKEFDAPLMVLSQLSRNVESRVNKRPLLSDLRESGCITGNMNIYLPNINDYVNVTNIVNYGINASLVSTQANTLLTSNIKRGYLTGLKLTYTIKTINQISLQITAEHKILTLKGWRPINLLSNKDLIGILDLKNFSKYLLLFYLDLQKTLPQLFFISVMDVRIFGMSQCYDLWIPQTNSYAVNNLLVHNSIEQDADLVLMLYRNSYYEKETEIDEDNITEIIITKHRNGPIGTVNILFEPQTVTFENFVF